MAVNIACPECKQKLRVPEDWLGQTVECPDCSRSFEAARDAEDVGASGRPPLPAGGGPGGSKPAKEEEDFASPIEEETEDRPRKKKQARRRTSSTGGYFGELTRKQRKMMSPHRGVLILILGISSLICSSGPVVGLVLGGFAYQMGTNDLNEMLAGRMDPSGQGITKVGRILGIVGCCLSLAFFVLAMFLCISGLAVRGVR